MLNIIEYDTPEDNDRNQYIVLESISSNTSKVIHVLIMNNTNRLVIGRGHEAHVRVTDISVSRLHAFIIKSNHGFYYLSDNNSKFGTLSLVKIPLQILPEQKQTVQIGRTVFELEIETIKKSRFCACFDKKSDKLQHDFQCAE